MGPVLIEKFNCGFLSKNGGGEVQLITSFLPFYWAILSVHRFVRKLWITVPRINLDFVNVASID
jgi:hypothetical protein